MVPKILVEGNLGQRMLNSIDCGTDVLKYIYS